MEPHRELTVASGQWTVGHPASVGTERAGSPGVADFNRRASYPTREPRIQYAQTGDGVSIAYWTLGEGMPLVYMPPFPFSHIQLEWQNPERRRWYQCLAEKRKVIC